ncbi:MULTISPECIES: AIR synthase family protein [Thermococcus]|uniref:Hydrogenase expression/formation protein HypE n=1 Tax=Thermococcus sibiricus (strain DSM 12597 / MM 739) TaxID=604354 RepID=C6A2I3_THESM|nr:MULTISPECIES: AIR synthase family protein [Thermococcus]ACS89828.1 Hydrogenase expression/formation protein HypE [Thermococcus sibiricus MM 739]KUK28225.1 MAG: Hydrogenase expression/formation protein HypE [Thermococcus sp. 40_45]MBC7095043.1 hydrogenase [Thermococcus sp.]HII67442.1 hydrogenase [Thermococcaceae archaeon]
MLPGKVPPEVLEKIVFDRLGVNDERVIMKSGVGIDAAAIDFGDSVLVATSDPITGAEKHIGFYAVNVNANDVATFGAKPKWFLVTILLPENADEELLEKIMEDMHKSAERLGISIVGGHTEVTVGLNRPIVIGTMLGEVKKDQLVTSNGAKPGDVIILTKGAGIEGTSIIATENEEELKKVFGKELVENAKRFLQKISVVKEALIAAKIGVHAMHDPTEGGIANGFHEMADAAGVGFRVYYEKIPIAEETRKLCEHFQLDPLALISSGSLLIAAPPEKAEKVVEAIRRKGIEVAIVGEFLEDNNVKVIVKDGKEIPLKRPETDEIWKLF